MTTDSLSQMLSDFLDGAHAVVVVEDGAIAFDLADRNIPFPVGTTNACCMFGQASGILCGGCWMLK